MLMQGIFVSNTNAEVCVKWPWKCNKAQYGIVKFLDEFDAPHTAKTEI